MDWEERKKYYDSDYYDTDKKPPYRDWWWTDPMVWSPRAKAIKSVFNPSSVLDCGCAKGSLVKYLFSLYDIDAIGFDLSEDAINDCPFPEIRQRLLIHDIALGKLPYPDKNFDLSVCVDFFEHQDDEHLDIVIEEIERLTARIILIRQPFFDVNTGDPTKFLYEMLGRNLETRWHLFRKYGAKELKKDSNNIEHPNTITRAELLAKFKDFQEIECNAYLYDVVMGSTCAEMSHVFPFYETIVLERI